LYEPGNLPSSSKAQMNQKIFPTILIILDIAAAIGYLPTGDYRKVIYWLAAAVLTTVVTW
jgi:hypothetical protein